ncbi:MAG: hypothetical protein ACHP9Z_08150 [Streptosporangiales bacterium]
MIRWIRRWYGANPLHLLALLAAFALAGYAVHDVVAAGQWRGFAEWFVVAIIGHDLLLFPLYSLADLSLRGLLRGLLPGRRRRARTDEAAGMPGSRPPVLNYVRIPVMFSLLVLMAFFPLILGLSQGFYQPASGLGTQPYLWRWLGVTGVMFAISAIVYAGRTRRAIARSRRAGGPNRRQERPAAGAAAAPRTMPAPVSPPPGPRAGPGQVAGLPTGRGESGAPDRVR